MRVRACVRVAYTPSPFYIHVCPYTRGYTYIYTYTSLARHEISKTDGQTKSDTSKQ